MSVNELENLPLSHLFSGPLVAAIDATVQVQRETIELLREAGYDENGDLITVGFDYPTTEPDPETGGRRQVVKRLELPLLLFLTLPNLQISRIEEQFSAKITQVEKPEDSEDERAETARRTAVMERTQPLKVAQPRRLNVTPSDESTSFSQQTKAKYNLEVKMVAEVQNETRGVEILERAVNTVTTERTNEEKTNRLREDETETDGGSPVDRAPRDDE